MKKVLLAILFLCYAAISFSAPLSGTNVSAPVLPFDSADTYPTHVDTYGKGGYRVVADTTTRDLIPSDRRSVGMSVYSVADKIDYVLGSDLTTWLAKNYVFTVGVIGDLRLIDNATSGMVIQLSGYHTIGDGAGGPVRSYLSGAAPGTYVDNGGSIIVPSGGDGSAAWVFSDSGYVPTVDEFGAIGDGVSDDYSAIVSALTVGPTRLGAKTYYSGTSFVVGSYKRLIGLGQEVSKLKFPAGVTVGLDITGNYSHVSSLSIDMTTKAVDKSNRGVRIYGGARNTVTDFRVVSASTGWEIYEPSGSSNAYGNVITNFNVGSCDSGFKLTGYGASNLVNGNHISDGYIINYVDSGFSLNQTRGNSVGGILIGGTSASTSATRPFVVTASYGNLIDVEYIENDVTAAYVCTINGGAVDNTIRTGQVGSGFAADIEWGSGNEQYRNTARVRGTSVVSSYSNGAAVYPVQAGIDARYTGIPDYFRFGHSSSANSGYVRYNDGIGGSNVTLMAFNPDNVQIPSGSYLKLGTVSGLWFGNGSPEGVVTATKGLYLNLTGGAGTTLYVKESGTGNTGWVAK